MDPIEAGAPPAVFDAFEHAPAIIWLTEGPDHRIVAANRMARASVGDRRGLVGEPARSAVPEAEGKDVFELLDRAYRDGEPVRGEERRVVVDHDGEQVEGYFTFSIVPVAGPGGRRRLLSHAVDVTASVHARQRARAEAEAATARLRAERRVVLDLQRAMLPCGLPVLPDLGLGASYVPAAHWATAGGDWYDVVTMDGDLVGLVLGDVVGHGPTASGVMGQLRAVAAERLRRGGSVAEALDGLDSVARMSEGARGTTVCVAVLDRVTGELECGSRGHPLPLVLRPDGATRFLDGPVGPPLAYPAADSPVRRASLPESATLVLFSDGAVEAPGRSITAGRAELATRVAQVAREAAGGDPRALADRVCATVTAHLVDRQNSRDDVSVLAATRLADPAPPLILSVPAASAQLARVQHDLGAWLDGLAVGQDDRAALVLAAVEAATNSIEHGYRGAEGTVHLTAALDRDGSVSVTVADEGSWRPLGEPSGFRGRGLMIMRECSDDLDLRRGEAGTTVHLSRRVSRSPVVSPRPAPGESSPIARTEPDIQVVRAGGQVRVEVAGTIDTAATAALRAAILDATRAGTAPCAIVLDKVDLLTSAALRVLFERVTALRRAGREVSVIAAPGTPAGAALAVSGLSRLLPVRPTG